MLKDWIALIALEHDPEKARPRTLIRGWNPVFGKDHARTKSESEMPIQPKIISP
jgi:hypothetical protein